MGVCEKAGRYEDMLVVMKDVAEKAKAAGKELSFAERNLLSVAFKKVIEKNTRRAVWEALADSHEEPFVATLKQQLVDEIVKVANEAIETATSLTVDGAGGEANIFYKEMAAKYYRYL